MGNMGVIRGSALSVAAAGILALNISGAAAQEPPPGVIGVTDMQGATDWTGLYIGGKVGGAWSDIKWTAGTNDFTTAGLVPVGTTADFSPSGVIGGVIGGGNLQVGRWIFGVELSYSGVNLEQSITSPYKPATDTFTTKIDSLGAIEGRIGFTWNRFLLFGKGGWVGSNAELILVNNANGTTATTEGFVDGWSLGGGVELLTWGNVVFGLEYDYVNLNLSDSSSCPLCIVGIAAGTPSTVTGDATISSVMVRASYLFLPEDDD